MTGDTAWALPDASDRPDLERQCVFAAHLLWREFGDIFGHVSRRLSGTNDFLVKPMRVALAAADSVQETDVDGRPDPAGGRLPREVAIHAEIFRARPDIDAIVHAHPHWLTALSAAGETVRPITQQAARFGREVPVTIGDFVETREQGEALAAALGASNEIIQKGHGAVTVGTNLPLAVGKMLYLEQTAQQMLAAWPVRRPDDVSDEMMNHPLHAGSGAPVMLWQQHVWESERGHDESK